MTIEACVEFCDEQRSRLAGLEGGECSLWLSCLTFIIALKSQWAGCANIFNPKTCLESATSIYSEPSEVGLGCPGNRRESCGTQGPPKGEAFITSSSSKILRSSVACSTLSGRVVRHWLALAHGGFLISTGEFFTKLLGNAITETAAMCSDSAAIHALSQNAAELASPPPSDNLTTVTCVTTCNNTGTLAVQPLITIQDLRGL